jgi:hypothetical protein
MIVMVKARIIYLQQEEEVILSLDEKKLISFRKSLNSSGFLVFTIITIYQLHIDLTIRTD